jgi:protein SCO1/2
MTRLLLMILLLWALPAQAAFDPFTDAGIDRIKDAHLPGEAAMVDQNGEPLRLQALFGGPPLLFAAVAYTCPNLCGLTLDGLFAGLAGAGLTAGKDYQLVVVGLDPRDGPDQAAAMLGLLQHRWHSEPSALHFLSGPEGAAVTQAMGFRAGYDPEHQQFAHISAVAAVTAQGRLSAWLMGVQFDPRALRLALVKAGEGRVGTLGDQALLLCYGYDPVHGRYGWLVERMLKVGGVVTLLGLFGTLGWLWRRGRVG